MAFTGSRVFGPSAFVFMKQVIKLIPEPCSSSEFIEVRQILANKDTKNGGRESSLSTYRL
jgi:hypothetical protein